MFLVCCSTGISSRRFREDRRESRTCRDPLVPQLFTDGRPPTGCAKAGTGGVDGGVDGAAYALPENASSATKRQVRRLVFVLLASHAKGRARRRLLVAVAGATMSFIIMTTAAGSACSTERQSD